MVSSEHYLQADAQSIPLPADSVDLVVTSPPYAMLRKSTYGGIPEVEYIEWFMPIAADIARVLKPGGRFCFLEHVAAPQRSWLRRLQRGVRPVWSSLLDGCRPDAETAEQIARAGFSQLKLEEFQGPLPVVSPHICGFAEKSRESA